MSGDREGAAFEDLGRLGEGDLDDTELDLERRLSSLLRESLQ